MKATIQYNNQSYTIDFDQPIDISLALQENKQAASAWYCPPVSIDPVQTEHFVGDVNLGGAVNFRNISFNPHGNGTHTECVGHISKEFYSINQVLKKFLFMAQLVSIHPEQQGADQIITLAQIKAAFDATHSPEAFLIRTLPNTTEKRTKQYSNSNPPFVEAAAMAWLYQQGIRHFMIDTPSVDKEFDDGVLAAHHAYWDYPNAPRLDATITELIFVEESIHDAPYLLHLQVAALENDASPSRPVLYALK
jgi:kynurenine formamidase